MSPNGVSSHCSNALQVWQIAYNNHIKSVADSLGQKHGGCVTSFRL